MRWIVTTLLFLLASVSWSADNLITPGTTSTPINGRFMYLQTADDHLVPAIAVFSTDGNGHLTPIPGGGGSGTVGAVNQGNAGSLAQEWFVTDHTSHLTLSSILGQLDVPLSVLAASLSSIDTKFDVSLSTRASEATLGSFRSANHTDLTTVQSKQDIGNASLASLDGKTVHVDTNNVTVVASALPSGAATSALQTVGNSSLGSIDSKLGTLGQKLSVGSAPVVMASDQSPIPVSQSGTWDLRNITGTVSLPTGASTSANQLTLDTDLLAFKSASHTDLTLLDTDLNSFASANHTDTLGVQTRQDTTNTRVGDLTETAPVSDTASSGLNGRLQRVAQNVTTGNGTLSTINGKIANNYGSAAGSIRTAAQVGNASGVADFNAGTTTAQTLRVVLPTDQTSIPAAQSGTWTVQQGSTPTSVANAWPTKLTDGTSIQAVKAASTAATATDPAGVVALSPNTPLPAGTNNMGSLTNITGTISLPTGASTAANQVTQTTAINQVDTDLNSFKSANHTDVTANTTALNSFANQNHTDLITNEPRKMQDGAGNPITSRAYDSTRPVDVYMPQVGASNVNHVFITPSANVSTLLLAANPARKWVIISNSSGAAFSIGLGFTAVVNQGLTVANNTDYVMNNTALWLGAINGIVGSNGRTIEIIEGY